MGEVYRAKDTRLDRTVAIKILSDASAADPEFRSRFEREARTISQLSHPHICALYDVGEATAAEAGAPTAYLVLEYLEGETLADRLKKGPLPLAQALEIATEVAGALAKAHRLGIVHRDLKPANIMLTKAGSKLLDFGLAKMGGSTAPAGAETRLATNLAPSADPLTARGTILGTFQYMAPEQIEGHDVDARTDIWAFGCVLHEMVTGKRTFEGRTQASLIAAILERVPPPLTELQPLSPPALSRIVSTCLAKDPDDRFQTAHDVGLQLEWIADGSSAELRAGGSAAGLPAPVAGRRKHVERAAWIGGGLVVGAMAAVAAWLWKPVPPVAPNVVTRFSYQLPQDQNVANGSIAVSPDGTKLAYVANRQIYIRAMDQMDARPVQGSNENPTGLAFSPDNQWIAYFSRVRTRSGGAGTLKKIPITGGTPQTICELVTALFELSWRGDSIVFAQAQGTTKLIQAVDGSGGALRSILTVDLTKEDVSEPQLFADGRHLLMTYARADPGAEGTFTVVVQALDGGTRHVLAKPAYDARILPTGHLIYRSGRKLFGAALESTRLELRGTPVTLIEGVRSYAVSDSGTLAFIPGDVVATPEHNTLVWVDRQGRETPLAAKPRAYAYPRISPDGTRIVVDSRDEEYDLWTWNIARETLSRLTFSKDAADGYPIWTLDGEHVIYRTDIRTGPEVFRARADGTGGAESLTKGPYVSPHSISPDGKQLVYRDTTDKTGRDLFVLPLGPAGVAKPLIQTEFQEENAEISPDGRWIAYESNESGERNIFVRPFPAVDSGKSQVSSGGGWGPMWSRNSRELFYRSANEFLVADVAAGPVGAAFAFNKPRALFPFGYLFAGTRTYDISPDGRKFLMVKPSVKQVAPTTITVVTNWFDEVRTRVAGK
jgi:Tol biopolymer transport system component